MLFSFLFFFYCSGDLRDLHSFPTRRSSDLSQSGVRHPLSTCVQRWSATTCGNCPGARLDRKSTRLNSSHVAISYAVFCLKKKKNIVSCRHTRSYTYTVACHCVRSLMSRSDP